MAELDPKRCKRMAPRGRPLHLGWAERGWRPPQGCEMILKPKPMIPKPRIMILKTKLTLLRVIPTMAFNLAYLLTFYLATLLAFYLAFYLRFYLAFYLEYPLTFYLAYLLTFHLAYLSGIPSGISSDILSGISSDILSGISSDILSGILFGILYDFVSGRWGPVEVRRGPRRAESRRLRPGEAHSAPNLAGLAPARPTAPRLSPVEVRRGPQRSDSRRLRSGESHSDRLLAVGVRQGPLRSRAGKCGLANQLRSGYGKCWQMWSCEAHCDQEMARRREKEGRRRKEGRKEGGRHLLKSNNFHLAGGEKRF